MKMNVKWKFKQIPTCPPLGSWSNPWSNSPVASFRIGIIRGPELSASTVTSTGVSCGRRLLSVAVRPRVALGSQLQMLRAGIINGRLDAAAAVALELKPGMLMNNIQKTVDLKIYALRRHVGNRSANANRKPNRCRRKTRAATKQSYRYGHTPPQQQRIIDFHNASWYKK